MSKGKPINVEYQTLVILWLALLASQAIFFAIVWFAKPEIFTAEARGSILHNLPLVTVVFTAIAILFFVLSFVLKRQYMRRAARDHDAGCVQTGLLLGCVLSEVSSVLGLVLAFVFNHPYFYLWLALGALGIFLHFPRKGNLDAATSTSVR
ncbi:MAG: hypothetical protein DMF63_16940 [Acidobacteria bacterium]|nr:MAG: hypothetical protein DMF63_16940 [Acidobacteriota bacterium]